MIMNISRHDPQLFQFCHDLVNSVEVSVRTLQLMLGISPSGVFPLMFQLHNHFPGEKRLHI